jgi:Ca2+-transporting ATPase
MVLAVFLALGGWRLAQGQVLVRRTAAIEALGAISVLCVDKTGTLTRNRMRLAALWRRGARWPARDPAGSPCCTPPCWRAPPILSTPWTARLHAAARRWRGPAPAASRSAAAGAAGVHPGLARRSGGGVVSSPRGRRRRLRSVPPDAAQRREAGAAVSAFARQGLRVLGSGWPMRHAGRTGATRRRDLPFRGADGVRGSGARGRPPALAPRRRRRQGGDDHGDFPDTPWPSPPTPD